MAPKRSRVAAHDDAAFEAKRCRRLGQLVAEYGADETLMGSVTIVVCGVEHVVKGDAQAERRLPSRRLP